MERTEAVTRTNMCMIYDTEGHVLVEEKVDTPVKGIIFPGGHVEPQESIVDSVIREVYEESGLLIKNLEFCGIKDWVEENGSRYMVFLYRTNQFSGSLKSSSEGRVFWASLEELKTMNVLWHLGEMMEIFLKHGVTELYFNKNSGVCRPQLK